MTRAMESLQGAKTLGFPALLMAHGAWRKVETT